MPSNGNAHARAGLDCFMRERYKDAAKHYAKAVRAGGKGIDDWRKMEALAEANAKAESSVRHDWNDSTAKKFLVRLLTMPNAPWPQRMEIRSPPNTLRCANPAFFTTFPSFMSSSTSMRRAA